MCPYEKIESCYVSPYIIKIVICALQGNTNAKEYHQQLQHIFNYASGNPPVILFPPPPDNPVFSPRQSQNSSQPVRYVLSDFFLPSSSPVVHALGGLDLFLPPPP
jgi:hypothetical protein